MLPDFFQKYKDLTYSLLIGLAGCLFFMPFLGGVHLFDWDEINFAEISREMIALDDYLRVHVNFKPFWEKPPFFFWMQAICMHIWGVGEYAARFPNAVCGVISLVILYLIGKRLYDRTFGLLWALAYFGSTLPFLYFKSGIIDPFFNLFIFGGLYGFILFYWKKDKFDSIALPKHSLFYLCMGGLVLGLAIITKGPVAYMIVCLCLFVYWIMQRLRFYVNVPQFLLFTVFASLITLGWYGLETWKNGPWFIQEFTRYQYRLFSTPDAGHAGFPGYHFIVILVGCFPASLFAIRSFFKVEQEKIHQRNFRTWMLILFWVVLILFTIVQSKIVHYSSLAYFPLTYLAALTMYMIVKKQWTIPSWLYWSIGVIGGIYVLATIATPFIGMNISMLKPLFEDDPFAVGNLEADISWTGIEAIAGMFLLVALIASLIWLKKGNFSRGLAALYMGNAVFIMLTLFFFINKIEGYSQAAAIRFYQSLKGKDCYVTTAGFKSYGQLFYFEKPPGGDPRSSDKQWLYTSDEVDKDVYVVAKVHKAYIIRDLGRFEEIGEENGFVFFKRELPGK